MIHRLGCILVLGISLILQNCAVGAEKDKAPATGPTVGDLAKAVTKGTAKSQIEALDALTDYGSDAKSALPQMIEALSSKDSAVRWHAARAIGAVGAAAAPAAPKLVVALNDSDPKVRAHAANALGEIGPASKKYLPDLIAKVTDPSPQVRRQVIEALPRIHPNPR